VKHVAFTLIGIVRMVWTFVSLVFTLWFFTSCGNGLMQWQIPVWSLVLFEILELVRGTYFIWADVDMITDPPPGVAPTEFMHMLMPLLLSVFGIIFLLLGLLALWLPLELLQAPCVETQRHREGFLERFGVSKSYVSVPHELRLSPYRDESDSEDEGESALALAHHVQLERYTDVEEVAVSFCTSYSTKLIESL